MSAQPEIKQLAGVLNTDDANDVLPAVHHKMAFNGRFRGNGNNMRFENIPGTRNIEYVLPTGDNITMGGWYDALRKRIFYFIFNTDTNNQIAILNLSYETIEPLIISNIGTDGDVLAFDITKPITSVCIIYGDDTQGDILYWINSQNEPCQINIKQQLAGDYGTVERSFLDVCKEIPDIPPQVVYEDDATVTVNNLRKKLFKLKTRFVFNNDEKSCWSAHSIMPLPLNYGATDQDADPTKNAAIATVLQTGSAIVKKIEIAACYSIGNLYSKFFEVAVLDKAELSIPDNDTTIFRFYNDKGYNYIDEEESVQLYDLVPLEANAMEVLNGNVLIYGGIKENYDNLATLGNTAIASSNTNANTTQQPVIMVATQDGKSAFSSGNIHVIILGKVSDGDVFTITTDNGAFTYTAVIGDDTAAVIAAVLAAAVVAGFASVSSDSNNLYVSKASTQLTKSTLALSAISFSATDSSYAHDWYSVYSFGLQYFDKKGRAVGGVQTIDALSAQSIAYQESPATQIPQFNLSIYHRPPQDAFYYHIVRTNNLSESKFLYWISDRTFADLQTEPDNYKYAWISIENLNTFIKNNPNSPLGYDFASGDRIRFVKLFQSGALTNKIIEVNKDFEIQASVTNPVINGVQHEGQFLKIILPTVDTNFNFGINTILFVGDVSYNNYLIKIYTPAKSVEGNLNVYNEFSERYAIGNPTLATRFHQGQIQNQSTDLVTPATFQINKGDFYYRERTINTGVELDYLSQTAHSSDGRLTLGVDFVDATYDDPNIQTGNSPFQDLIGFNVATNDDRWLLKVISGTYTFRIKGSIIVDFEEFGESYSWFLQDNEGTITYLVPPRVVQQGSNVFPFDVTFQLSSASNPRIFIFGYSSFDQNNEKDYSGTSITITRELNFTQGIIDANFSDYYASAVNSNSRQWVIEPNSKQVYNSALMRWGLFYLQDSVINQTNRFYPQNQDTIDRAKGDIRRFKVRERIMRIFQSRGCGQVGVYTKFVQDSGNTNILSTTDEIITRNNVQYYQGEVGLGNHPECLASTIIADYFVNQYTGEQYRLSQDGLTNLSKLYKGEYYIKDLLSSYNKTWTRADGSLAKILGCFDYFEGDYITLLQSGTNGSDTIGDYMFAFNEKRNAYHDFFNIYPEWILSAEDKVYSWLDGQLYVHDNTSAYNTFYGTKYPPYIKLVFNAKEDIKKGYLAVAYQSNKIWVSDTNGDINTSMVNEQTGLQQISQLKSVDYDIQENIRYAAFLFDANSGLDPAIALVEGDVLQGTWIEIKFVYLGDEYAYLYLPYITYQISQRNF